MALLVGPNETVEKHIIFPCTELFFYYYYYYYS